MSAVAPTLAARAGAGLYEVTPLAQRFQVADSDQFTNILSSGMGSVDASGVARYTVSPPLPPGRRVVWRRARRKRRCVRTVVERDGVYDRGCRVDAGAADGAELHRPTPGRPTSGCPPAAA